MSFVCTKLRGIRRPSTRTPSSSPYLTESIPTGNYQSTAQRAPFAHSYSRCTAQTSFVPFYPAVSPFRVCAHPIVLQALSQLPLTSFAFSSLVAASSNGKPRFLLSLCRPPALLVSVAAAPTLHRILTTYALRLAPRQIL